jgi:uncharacterized protein YbaR (Trm112 family)
VDLALVEHLVCPEPHEPTPLVVRVDETNAGDVRRAAIGCPVCRGSWTIDNGVVRLGVAATLEENPSPDQLAVAALLDLHEPGIVLSDGLDAGVASGLNAAFGATVIAFDATVAPAGVTVIEGARRAPIAAEIARGAVLLRPDRHPEFVASVATALVAGGRMLAAASIAVPAGVREIARDDQRWLGERVVVSAPVSLRRRTH